jgi:hypothetical protein
MGLFQSLSAQEAPDQFPEPGAREENYAMKVTVRVIDENGNPMGNTPIRIGIHNVNEFKDMYNDFRGVTDAEGKFSAEAIGRGLAKIDIEKEGYYPSHKTVTCYDGTAEQIREAGRFFPWNPVVDIMVKEIGKPIPMLVRRAWGGSKSWIIPELEQFGKELGWDLVEGDWVAPAGTGEVADLVVTFGLSRTDDRNHSSSMKIRMGNPDDGFIVLKELKGEESLLSFPRTAPADGYEVKNLEFGWEYNDGTLNRLPADMPKGYLFRLRTTKDKDGKIISAIYGKITKPFDFQASSTGHGSLQAGSDYYLNLTPNDRNLEYDQKNNLAPEADKDLRWPP